MYSVDMRAAGRWGVLVMAGTAQFLILLDATVVNLALPSVRVGLAASRTDGAWVVNGYLLCLAALLLAGGRVADRVGRFRVFGLGSLAFGSASLGCACATSVQELVAMRCAQGASAAFVTPAALGIVIAHYRASRERHTALGVWSALGGIGATAGVIGGGALVQLFSWRAVFLLNVPVAVGVAVVALTLVSQDPRGRGARTPRVTTVPAERSGGARLAWRDRRLLGLRDSAAFRVGATGQLILGGVQNATLYLLSIHAQRVIHLSPLDGALVLLPTGSAAVATGALGRRIVTRIGVQRTWLAAATCATAALTALALTALLRPTSVVALAPTIVLGAAFPLISLCGTATATQDVQTDGSASRAGVVTTAFNLGAAIGIASAATGL